MKLNAAGVVAVVALVALAGCTGFAPGSSPGASPTADTPETDEPTEPTDYDDDTETDEDAETDDDDESSDVGVVRFYISDEENAISDFRHLNVTISEIGLQQAGDAESDDGEEPSETTAVDNETTAVDNETTAVDNGTEVPTEEQANSTETDSEDEESESGDWIEYDVDDRTFDLTKLQGANASLLDELETPEGSYSKVFVHVEEINATLQNGESVNVKLPSEKLQINQEFTVEANDTVDFVFDITVHKAGNSGKYILTPAISESGPDVPIENVDDEREEESEDETEEDETEEDETEEDETDAEEDESEENESEEETADAETQLSATLVGQAEPGANATVRVSMNGSAVANATVMVDGEVVGTTDETGVVTVPLPEDEAEVEIEVGYGDADAELRIELEEDGQTPPA
jgi:hypothetical protein